MRRHLLLPVVLASAGALVAGGCVIPPPGVQRLELSVVAEHLDHPWDMAFTPDRVMLVTERAGRIDAVLSSGVRTLAAPSDVVVASEGGMMGLAVDPAFATNRRIYTCFMSRAGGATDVRVVRWQVDGGYTTLTSRTELLTGIPVNTTGETGRHSGCRVRVGPDSMLWITTGDAVTGSAAPQDPTNLGGKVLRITTDGAPAPGNPGGAWRPEVYTLGHRNPQGVAFRPSDGQAFSVEHGPGCDDEVNLLVPGGNYGWNPNGVGGAYDEVRTMTDLGIPGARAASWSSGCPTIAPSGATFLTGSQWGGWNGGLAVAVLKDRHLRVLQFDQGGKFLTDYVSIMQFGRLRVAVQGPDGDLFLAIDATDAPVLRVHPA